MEGPMMPEDTTHDVTSRLAAMSVFELLELGLGCLSWALDLDEEVRQLPPGAATRLPATLDALSPVLLAMEEAEEAEAQ
jgi:hypothetical protein